MRARARAAVESHPVNYRGGGRQQIIAGPTANPVIAYGPYGFAMEGRWREPPLPQLTRLAGLIVPAGLYRERNIPEHPRTVEAIMWSNARPWKRGVIHQNARQMRDHG